MLRELSKKKTWRRALFVLAFGLIVGFNSGCRSVSGLNEGATRLAHQPGSKVGTANDFRQIYYSPTDLVGNGECEETVVDDECEGPTARLSLIKEGDPFAITLLSAYVCDFREKKRYWAVDKVRRWDRDGSNWRSAGPSLTAGCSYGKQSIDKGGRARQTRGEIALVVNAGEELTTPFSPKLKWEKRHEPNGGGGFCEFPGYCVGM